MACRVWFATEHVCSNVATEGEDRREVYLQDLRKGVSVKRMKVSRVGDTNSVPIIFREEMSRVAFHNTGASN